MQDIPARLFAYAEVAKKAQTELFDTVVALTPKAVEEAAAQEQSGRQIRQESCLISVLLA